MTGPRIGLALGGGSARGLTHITMLEVFDELGLKPSVIAGCSIGSLIGSAYASGISARDIREHTERLLSNPVDAFNYVFGAKRARLPDLLALRGLTSLHMQGEKLVELALPDGIPALIEHTQIPFKVIATDYDAMEERVFIAGPLVRAVGASIAIPGVILGPTIDGHVHVDGGVTNPVPFDHVCEGTDFVVAIDVTGRPPPPVRLHHSNMELAIGSLLIMFHQLAELRRKVKPPDIYVAPPLIAFSWGDFFKLKELFAAAQPAKDQLKRELDSLITKRLTA
jgi:NTE family protein